MKDNLRNNMIVNLTKKDFCNIFRKLNLQTEIDLEFFMKFKGNPVQKYTVMAICYL